MEILKVNETPVRTSRNFKINNIKLEDVVLPENVMEFKGLQVLGASKIETEVEVGKVTYGLGDVMQENVREMANSKIRITASQNNEDVKLFYTLDDENTALIHYVEIVAEKDLNVTIKYSSSTNYSCFVNGIIKIIASGNAKVNVVAVNLLNETSHYFVSMENVLQESSEVQYTVIDLGAKNSVQNYYSNIAGEGANNELKAIYLGRENQVKDMNYIAELYGEKTNVTIDVQGALKDSAKKNFKGTIDFKKGCKKARGDENEYCMLLSDKAKSIALPMLLCTEDDVEGNHATASGKLDDKEIFYIMSRGIEKKDATKLIVKARFNKILERIADEEIRNEIVQEIDRRLD